VTVVAWLYTAGSVTIPSMGSVYNEFALKRHMDTSLHLQNFFLYFYGMCFNLLFVTAMMLVSGSSFLSMFHGYSLVGGCLPVIVQPQGLASVVTSLAKVSASLSWSWITRGALLWDPVVLSWSSINKRPSCGTLWSCLGARLLERPSCGTLWSFLAAGLQLDYSKDPSVELS
jgi:hypothetical protein